MLFSHVVNTFRMKFFLKKKICLCLRDIDNLHLGGPQFCQDSFPSNITFHDEGSPRIKITLCGVPATKVEWKYSGRKVSVLNEKINKYTHNFTLELPQLRKIDSDKELTVTASGHNGILNKTTKICRGNCKLDHYIF